MATAARTRTFIVLFFYLIVLVESSRKAHPHETDAILLEPLVTDLLLRHEQVPDSGLEKQRSKNIA